MGWDVNLHLPIITKGPYILTFTCTSPPGTRIALNLEITLGACVLHHSLPSSSSSSSSSSPSSCSQSSLVIVVVVVVVVVVVFIVVVIIGSISTGTFTDVFDAPASILIGVGNSVCRSFSAPCVRPCRQRPVFGRPPYSIACRANVLHASHSLNLGGSAQPAGEAMCKVAAATHSNASRPLAWVATNMPPLFVVSSVSPFHHKVYAFTLHASLGSSCLSNLGRSNPHFFLSFFISLSSTIPDRRSSPDDSQRCACTDIRLLNRET
ncbi:hypothetical protein LZ31DRAFT_8380 [Colletotrichum somersetense]|nr:hypothetical protein LZ31DRAFT_8380 [Colletotrichum somersetense]